MTRGSQPEALAGLALAGGAFGIWGLSPLFWKLLVAVPAGQLLAHRIVWAVLVLVIFISARRGWRPVRAALRDRGTLGTLLVTTVLIAVNWFVYIWAVVTGNVLQASLGYYINPLVSVLFGIVILRETLSRLQRLALLLAAAGVLAMVAGLGELPWMALALAGSFGLYGLLRKTVRTEAVPGLLIESALLAPLCLLYLAGRHNAGAGAFGELGLRTGLLLAVSGLVTALPLVLFTSGARRLPLATIGFLQYLAPTLQFLLAVFVFGEPFTRTHLAAFLCIWTALAIFTWDLRRRWRRRLLVRALG